MIKEPIWARKFDYKVYEAILVIYILVCYHFLYKYTRENKYVSYMGPDII